MPTGAEQAAIIRDLIAQGRYVEAYRYTASQIDGNPAWNQGIVDWLELAADINGSQPNFWKDYVFASNAVAAGIDPDSAATLQLNQQVSDQLARQVLEDFASAFESGQTISPVRHKAQQQSY